MFTFLAVALHWELMVSCFSVVTLEFLQCCWNPGHYLWPSECEWNFCSSVCDLWFHWIQLKCVDAALHRQGMQISMYNQQDPSSPATVPVLRSSAEGILLVPSQGKLSGEWLRAEHFKIALTVLLPGSSPFLINFLKNLPVMDYRHLFQECSCLLLSDCLIGCVLRVQVFHGQYEFKEFLASCSHPGAAGRYLPFQLLVGLCWKPCQGSDPGMFHCKKMLLRRWMSEICYRYGISKGPSSREKPDRGHGSSLRRKCCKNPYVVESGLEGINNRFRNGLIHVLSALIAWSCECSSSAPLKSGRLV